MSLYLKYRPTNLVDIVGNKPTVNSLETVLGRSNGDIPHSFLFYGPHGCGKTTLARIVAKRLYCSELDFKEIDSADFRGIDTIRDIRRKMVLRPLSGPCRVFLLDEVQQLSKDAQSALLKALEDTPSHVYFLLATTDPEKLLKTILSRCMQFSVSPLSDRAMVSLLRQVVDEENLVIPDEILQQITKESLGHSRPALVMLDKISSLPVDKMERAIEQVAAEQNKVIELCRALLKQDSWKQIREYLKTVDDQEAETVRRAVLAYCSSVLLNGDNPMAFLVADCFTKPFYDTGKSGLILACYEALQLEKG